MPSLSPLRGLRRDLDELAPLLDDYPELAEVERALPMSAARKGALRLARRGGVGAELGVFTGRFSSEIYEALRPRRFFLVDLWHMKYGETFPDWGAYTARGKLRTEAALAAVRLRGSRMEGAAEIVVDDSVQWLSSLSPGSLDWVYVDTTHKYEKTMAELHAAARAIVSDGVILGDDCQIDPAHPHHGVFRAVRDFSRSSEFEIIWMDAAAQWAMRRTRTD